MGLEALLARMESRTVTPVTPELRPDVTPKPVPIRACTPVTSVTALNATDRMCGIEGMPPTKDRTATASNACFAGAGFR